MSRRPEIPQSSHTRIFASREFIFQVYLYVHKLDIYRLNCSSFVHLTTHKVYHGPSQTCGCAVISAISISSGQIFQVWRDSENSGDV